MEINLKAYRFSEPELKKLIELRQLFLENKFVTDRLPEVYYDDIGKYEHLFGKIKTTNEDTPDNLGVYHYNCELDELTTKEGIIVLFKDRIEAFCNRQSVDINAVRYIVLMHELGHWLTHWSEYNGENWKKGYGIDNPMTHESLAQLIAFWSINGKPECEKILREYLTPKDERNEYALYLKLKSHSKCEILIKLIEIRKHFFLNDYFLFGFLQSNSCVMIDFISGLFLNETLDKMSEDEIEKIKLILVRNSEVFEKQFCKNLIVNIDKMINNTECQIVTNYDKNWNKVGKLLSKLFVNNKCIDEVIEFLFKKRGSITGKVFGL